MPRSIRFRLNGKMVETEPGGGTTTLDWLRLEQKLTGTKEGCREGDCGACMVLLGQAGASGEPIEWIPVNSCLLAVEELDGRHLVTIEGLAAEGPTAVMRALHGENASQCGFCSPGVVVALTGRLIEGGDVDGEALASALEGNLCRCTGYASMRRAASELAAEFSALPEEFPRRLAALAEGGVLPAALAAAMGEPLPAAAAAAADAPPDRDVHILGGGTDWFVRHNYDEPETDFDFSDKHGRLRTIAVRDGLLEIGAAATVREFFSSPLVAAAVPGIAAFEKDVASPPIRSRATLAGNIANASPVADMTAMLLVLDAALRLRNRRTGGVRVLPLKDFFLGYKRTAAAAEEYIEALLIPDVHRVRVFSFEKAAKRARLDIAAVNTALACGVEKTPGGPILRNLRISAGGVGETPLLLAEAAAFAEGVPVHAALVRETARLAACGIRPIADVRGSAEYRSSMTERLVIAHFVRLFPELRLEEASL